MGCAKGIIFFLTLYYPSTLPIFEPWWIVQTSHANFFFSDSIPNNTYSIKHSLQKNHPTTNDRIEIEPISVLALKKRKFSSRPANAAM